MRPVPNQINHRETYFKNKGTGVSAISGSKQRGIVGPDGRLLTLAQQLGMVPIGRPINPDELVDKPTMEEVMAVPTVAGSALPQQIRSDLKPVPAEFRQVVHNLDNEVRELNVLAHGRENADPFA